MTCTVLMAFSHTLPFRGAPSTLQDRIALPLLWLRDSGSMIYEHIVGTLFLVYAGTYLVA